MNPKSPVKKPPNIRDTREAGYGVSIHLSADPAGASEPAGAETTCPPPHGRPEAQAVAAAAKDPGWGSINERRAHSRGPGMVGTHPFPSMHGEPAGSFSLPKSSSLL